MITDQLFIFLLYTLISQHSLSGFAPQNSVSRDGFGSPVPRQPAHLHTQAESGVYLRDSSRVPRGRPFIYLKPPYAIGSVPSLSGHAIAYQWRSLPRVRRHRASSPQGCSSNGCCIFRYHHGSINVRLPFPDALMVYSIDYSIVKCVIQKGSEAVHTGINRII